jgi:hypothetical protein
MEPNLHLRDQAQAPYARAQKLFAPMMLQKESPKPLAGPPTAAGR